MSNQHGDVGAEIIEFDVSSRVLADAINALHDGFVIFDGQDRLVMCNQNYRDIYAPASDHWKPGTSLETIARDTAEFCIGLTSADEVDNFVHQRLARHLDVSDWGEQRLRDGRWIRVSESRLANNWTVGIRTDITHIKKIEESLTKSEAQFRDYAETAADYFWEFNSDYRYTHISGRFYEVIGLQPEQVIGLNRDEMWALVDPEYKHHVGTADLFRDQQAFENTITDWYHTDGSTRVLSVSGRPIYGEKGEFLGYRGSCRDVTETYQLTEKLTFQATHDSLTQLYNRREFEQRLQAVISDTRGQGVEHAMCFLDLDQFKIVNDSCGHAAGDALLCQLGEVLINNTRKNDTVARLGGDEFAVLIENCNLNDAERVANSFRKAIIDFRFEWEKKSFSIGASVGLVSIPPVSRDVSEIMRQADAACYAAKDRGRNQIVVFNPEDDQFSGRQGEVKRVTQIDWALNQDRFQLYYQPIAAVNGSNEVYMEILIRMLDEDDKLLAPGDFLPAAERYKLINQIDRWVVQNALQWIKIHYQDLKNLYLCSINLSGQSLGDEDFYNFVEAQFDLLKVPANTICFEITETAAIGNLLNANRFIDKFKSLGCKFALDDFGSGLSSFAYLKNLPVDIIKIDGAFVRDCHENVTNLALVRSIHDIARVMGKKTVAEFVENDLILDKLCEIGVDFAQGYCISRPQSLDQFFDRQINNILTDIS